MDILYNVCKGPCNLLSKDVLKESKHQISISYIHRGIGSIKNCQKGSGGGGTHNTLPSSFFSSFLKFK